MRAVVAPGKLSEITTTEQGLKKLVAARTDVFVDLEPNIDDPLKPLNLSEFDMSAVYQAGIM